MTNPPLSSTSMRNEYSEWLCQTWEAGSKLEYVGFPGVGTMWNLKVAPPTVPAWELFAEAMATYEYYFRESAGGTFNPRFIAGSGVWSLHAYGLAIDLNPSKNGPQGTSNTDQPQVFRDSIESITTVLNDRQVFQWGGDWSGSEQDPMHWQIGATESEIGSGLTWEDNMPLNAADLAAIRTIVDEELDKMFTLNAEVTSRISRTTWQHGGGFSGTDDPNDNAQLTVKRIESLVKDVKELVEGLPGGVPGPLVPFDATITPIE